MNKSSVHSTFFLKDIEIFQDLTEAEVDAIGEKIPHKHYLAKTVFYTPEDEGEILFMLKQGRARLFRLSADGKTFTTATLEQGTFFGKMALLGQRLYGNYAEALTDCVICPISRENAKEYLIGDERIAYRIIETLGKQLIELEQRFADSILKQVPARLASLLLQFAEKQRLLSSVSSTTADTPVELVCTHENLAQMLGIHRETITRTLKEFSRMNLVKLGRGRITILNTNALLGLNAD